MACTLGPLVEEANQAAAAAYDICKVDPSGLTLTPEELRIVEKGSWCRWQPTYSVPDISGYLPTLVTHVKDKVYEELWAELEAKIAELKANAAMVYSTKLERVTGDEAMAGRLDASYAQWESGSKALTTSVQTALASQNYALSQQILETKATLDGKITANSEFYQTSLATVNGTMAASGVLNSVSLGYDSKGNEIRVVSGFRSEASSTKGSSFVIFADRFEILGRTPNGTGGYDYGVSIVPFRVENGVVTFTGKATDAAAQNAAGAAAAAAAAANAALAEIASDNVLSAVEKSAVIKEVNVLNNEQSGITAQAGKYGVSSSSYINAISALNTYLSGLTYRTAWNDTSGNTNITGSIFRKMFQDVYAARQTVLNSISGKAKDLIDTIPTQSDVEQWIADADYLLATDVKTMLKDNTTVISGSNILTGTIAANRIAANVLYGKQLLIDDTSTPVGVNALGKGTLAMVTTNTSFSALTGQSSVQVGHGVTGVNTNTSGGAGIAGWGHWGGTFDGKSVGVHATTAVTTGEWGFYTPNKINATQGFFSPDTTISFTGGHIAFTQDTLTTGMLVYANESIPDTVNQNIITVVKTSTQKDKRVLGVYNGQSSSYNKLITADNMLLANALIDNGYRVVCINALGEGGILVCNENGNIDNGDYLTSANLAGYAMKQDDDLSHSYTVAKALESVDWANETETTKLIACTYHAG